MITGELKSQVDKICDPSSGTAGFLGKLTIKCNIGIRFFLFERFNFSNPQTPIVL